jgi:hypothetical protein
MKIISPEEFAGLFIDLSYSKNFKIDSKRMIQVFYDDLKNLEYIKDVLIYARKKKYFRNMPNIQELIEDHHSLFKSRKENNNFQLEGPKLNSSKWLSLKESLSKIIKSINGLI